MMSHGTMGWDEIFKNRPIPPGTKILKIVPSHLGQFRYFVPSHPTRSPGAYLVRVVQNAKWKLKSATWTFKLPYTSWSILSVRSFASSCLRTFISAPLSFHKLYLLSMRCCFEMEAAAVLRMKSNEDRKQVSRLSKKNSIAYRPILCYFEFRKALIQFLSRLDVDSNQI